MPNMTAIRKPVQKASAVPLQVLQRGGKPAGPLHPVLRLQQTAGNQAVGQLIQAKLKVGQPGDKYEQEADRVADQVMRMPEPDLRRQVEPEEEEEEALQPKSLSEQTTGPLLQRKCAACASGQGLCPNCAREEEGVQRKPLASTFAPLIQRQSSDEFEEEEETLQPKTASIQTSSVNSGVEAHIQSLRGGGQSLPDSTCAFFEPRFGYDFSQVRVHTGTLATDLARAVNARAFTMGQDVVFGAGQYAPETAEGKRLLAHELVHTVQQGPGDHNVHLQRTCGSTAIATKVGTRSACTDRFDRTFVSGSLFRFNVNCDEFVTGQDTALTGFASGLASTATLEIHGFASVDGPPDFNQNLGCARALAARKLLTDPPPRGAGISASRITGVINHGPVPGPAPDRRSVVIRTTTPPTQTRHRFRVAAVSFLSCAECNPFTDDGTLGITPPTTEPPAGSSFRQKHFIEAELGTFDSRTIAPGSARLVSSGNNIGISGFCGVSTRAHVVRFVGPASATSVTSAAGIHGIQFESEMVSRVGARVPPTLPGSPCGFLGTNPLIPVISNKFKMRLFADGTKESEFVTASLYPSHFLYEDGGLKLFGGAPVHPRQDFFAWASSTVPLAVGIIGFKALRFACCNPRLSRFNCFTHCVGGFSVPGPPPLFDIRRCAAHGAALAATSCPTSCAPAGASCTPLVRPSNP